MNLLPILGIFLRFSRAWGSLRGIMGLANNKIRERRPRHARCPHHSRHLVQISRIAGIPREGGARRVVMEAGRIAGPDASGRLPFPCDRGFDVPVADPRQSRDFASAGGAPAKTDRVDAGIPAAFATCRCRASILRTGAPPGRSRPPTFRRGTGECGRSGLTTAPLEVRGRGSLAHLVEPVSRPAGTSRRADPVRPDARSWTGLWRDCGQSTPDPKKPQKRPNSRLTQNMDAFCSFPQAGECSP